MGTNDRLSNEEMREIGMCSWSCTDAAYAAVDQIMQSKKAEIDRITGLRTKLMNVCSVQIARYEELAKEWINFYGSLKNRGQGTMFKENFVNGVIRAVRTNLEIHE